MPNIRGFFSRYLTTALDGTETLQVRKNNRTEEALVSDFAIAAAPTRTVESVSAQASVSVSIPSGCTRFVMRSDEITLSDNSANIEARFYNTSDTVNSTVDAVEGTVAAAMVGVAVSAGAAFAYMAADTATTDRWLMATVDGPRASGVKTTFQSRAAGKFAVTDELNERWGVATSAQDDDTVRILVDAGTFTGDIYFDWYYG